MNFDLINDRNKKVHFIGIGGISMSGLAEILLKNNFKVSGSDMHSSSMTDKLKNMGANIFIGHKRENLDGIDLVVYTAAISNDNPELKRAFNEHIPTMDRAEFLGQLMKNHKLNIAIAGTHGKTTTTSMVSNISLEAELDPTILVGGELDILKGNVRTGKSDYFITEACEYKASFLKFFPYIGVILNIDADHLDYYKDIEDIKNTFLKFANLIPEDGYLVACSDDAKMSKIINNVKCNIVTYGINSGNIQAKNIKFDEKGCASFTVVQNGSDLFSIQLKVPGTHNVLNSLASICVSLILEINPNDIINGLEEFFGARRRFELKGVKNNITVVDDYAHHPTEIKATLNATKNFPHKKLFCIFQPHTYTRTKSLFKEFSECFNHVDTLILADIYAAREKDTGIVSSNMLGDKIRENNVNCLNLHSFNDILDYLEKEAKEGDLILTMGAGDIYKVGESFLK